MSKSAWAFHFYLEGSEEPAKATSQCEPFFDAIACDDLGAARAIAERSRTTWNADEEYEEDFLYARFLMDRFALGAGQAHLEGLLRRYEQLLAGGEDSRLELCRALLEGNQKLFDETLDRLIDDRKRESEKKMKSGRVSPNDAATVFHLWMELLALLRFARQAKLMLARNYPLAPSVARRVELARLPPGESWKDLHSYYDLE
ncbi:Imm49 family immunity protein [Archangium lansingense]|uniref:Imm49 family immunity protein n=1 Tax=Archangium lansingense TaxID=2995310 RepID=UPI003B80B650